MSLVKSLNNASAFSVSAVRLARGLGTKTPATHSPKRPLELYEFEACPYCRKVRETLSALDLEYISRSCARGSESRRDAVALGGKAQFPLLIDPNSSTTLYESEDIIDYLHKTYGQERGVASRVLAPLNTLGASIASAVRPRGRRVYKPLGSQRPEKLVILYNIEGSPYCRKVREVLCELDLDCHIKTTTSWGPRREELIALGGKKTVPFLVDPNTQTAMYESDDIVKYLRTTYDS